MSTVDLGFIPPAQLMDNKFIIITKSDGSSSENLTQVETLENGIKFVLDYLYEQNLNNFLTADAKMDNWKFCLPVVVNSKGEIDYTKIYAGFSAKDGHAIYSIENDDMVLKSIPKDMYANLRFLIGVEPVMSGRIPVGNPMVKNGVWFAADARQSRYITDFNDVELSNKTIVSIYKIKGEKKFIDIKV